MYSEILPRLCEFDPLIDVAVFTARRTSGALPVASCIRHERVFSPERLMWPSSLLGGARPVVRAAFTAARFRRQKASIWHSTYYTVPRSWRGPVVTTVFDLIQERFPSLFTLPQDAQIRKQKTKCIRSSDVIVSISNSTKDDLVSYYDVDPDKVVVVHLAAGSTFTSSSGWDPRLNEGRPYILFVGDRLHYKNAALLFEAYRRWASRTEVDLLFVGPPPSNAEKLLVDGLGDGGRVRFLTGVDDGALAAAYRGALVFVYPSLYEGFGLPLLEAMGSGCPVVASAIPSSVEVAGDAASYFDPNDPDSLIQALDGLLAESVRGLAVREGHARALEFSWGNSAQRLVDLYRGL